MSDTARAIQENSVLRWKAKQDQKIIHEQRLVILRLEKINAALLDKLNGVEQLNILDEG